MEWSNFEKGVFLVNLLGIIYDPTTRKILIGKRVNDPNLKELSWVFPGGRPDYKKELEENLVFEIKENTGLEVDCKNIIYAKTYPEIREFLSIYYYCEIYSSKDAVARGNLKEVMWVKPSDVTKYFTTSLHPAVLAFLKTLD